MAKNDTKKIVPTKTADTAKTTTKTDTAKTAKTAKPIGDKVYFARDKTPPPSTNTGPKRKKRR